MTRDEALALVQARVKNPNMIGHMVATEAIMGALAGRAPARPGCRTVGRHHGGPRDPDGPLAARGGSG